MQRPILTSEIQPVPCRTDVKSDTRRVHWVKGTAAHRGVGRIRLGLGYQKLPGKATNRRHRACLLKGKGKLVGSASSPAASVACVSNHERLDCSHLMNLPLHCLFFLSLSLSHEHNLSGSHHAASFSSAQSHLIEVSSNQHNETAAFFLTMMDALLDGMTGIAAGRSKCVAGNSDNTTCFLDLFSAL